MAVDAAPVVKNTDDHRYKMKDLCERTGLSRQVVHFYIQQGLLPEGKKTGKNMAYYNERHVERLLTIRKLQHEHFLPLKAIRALLDEQEDAFSPAQRETMREVRSALSESLRPSDAPRATVDVRAEANRLGLSRTDVEELIDEGLIAVAEEQDLSSGERHVVAPRDDMWLLETIAEVRRAGLTRELGFSGRDFAMYDDAIRRLVTKEARLVAERIGHLPPKDLAETIEKLMPLIEMVLVRMHKNHARNLFAALG